MATYRIQHSNGLNPSWCGQPGKISPHISQNQEIFNNGWFSVSLKKKSQEMPMLIEHKDEIFFVYGTPHFHKQAINLREFIPKLARSPISKYSEIDSSFLIISVNSTKKSWRIITDRFNSRLCFFAEQRGAVSFSTEYLECLSALSANVASELDHGALLEFLWFRRLFGIKTFSSKVTLIPSGTVRSGNASCFEDYCYFSYKHDSPVTSFESAVDLMVGSVREAVNKHLNPGQKHALMLSGGLDSRLMLAAGESWQVGITNSLSFNNEVNVALELAQIAGLRHKFLKRPKDYLTTVLDQALTASNGMTVFYECQFLGYAEQLKKVTDTVHLGLFFDIFFCGHYLPKYQRQVLKRNVLFFSKRRFKEENIVDEFIANVTYRQKSSPISAVLADEFMFDMAPVMRASIEDEFSKGADTGLTGEGLWEFMHLNNVGRHYSILMEKSIRPFIDTRLPALSIKNYELALSLSPDLKRNWQVYLKCLKQISGDRAFMDVRNSNTNMPAKYSLKTHTLLKAFKAALRSTGYPVGVISPSFSDRSWPPVRDSITGSRVVSNRIREVIREGRLAQLGITKPATLLRMLELTEQGEEDHSVLLNQILTLEVAI